MSAQSILVRIFWKWIAPLVGLAGIGLAFYFFFHTPRERAYRLRATAGNKLGMRNRLAESLRVDVAAHGIHIDLQESKGSEDALDMVNNRTLALGAGCKSGMTATCTAIRTFASASSSARPQAPDRLPEPHVTRMR